MIIIDEAQHLQDSHYGWLMDIYNELDRVNIDINVMLVGQQQELKGKKGSLQVESKAQIVGRFMVHEYEFSGIREVDDLKTCLIGYDEESEYPAESGFTYTQYFFPHQYKSGFRLSDYASDLFDAFVTLRQIEKITGQIEIPKQYITRAVENILIRYGVDGEGLEHLTPTQFEESIKYSGYVEAELFKEVV